MTIRKNIRQDVLLKMLATLLLIVFLVIPGTAATRFQGLPLTNWQLALSFVALTVLWATNWPKTLRLKQLLIGSLMMLIVLQVVGQFAFGHYGWSLCTAYGLQLENEALPKHCEPSAQVRVRSDVTQIIPTVDLNDRNLPLYFMNNGSYNFYLPDQPDRQHLPYRMRVATIANAQQNASVTVSTNIPNTHLYLSGIDHIVAINQDASFELPARTETSVSVVYSTTRQPTDRLSVTLHHATPFHNGPARSAWLLWLYISVFGLVLLTFATTIAGLMIQDLRSRPSIVQRVLVMWLLWLIVSFYLPILVYPLFGVTVGAITLTLLILQSRKHTLSFWPILLFGVFAFVFVSRVIPYPYALLFSGGNDELGHETFARLVVTASNWHDFVEGGEGGLFYYQPFHRYVLAMFHKLTGDSMWGPYVIQTFVMAMTAFFTSQLMFRLSRWAGMAFVVLFTIFSLHPSVSAFSLAQTGYQQSIATPLFLLAIMLTASFYIMKERRLLPHFGLGLLFGSIVMMRTDFLPALLGLLIYALAYWKIHSFRQSVAPISALFVGLAVIPLCILWRNIDIAHQTLLFPTSGMVNLSPQFWPLFHYHGGPVAISGVTMLTTVIKHYQHDPGTLLHILRGNVLNGMIGTGVHRKVLWVLWIVSVITALIYPKLKAHRTLILLLLGFLLPVLLVSSFFIMHNGWAMLVHFDYLMIVISALVVGLLFDRTANRA